MKTIAWMFIRHLRNHYLPDKQVANVSQDDWATTFLSFNIKLVRINDSNHNCIIYTGSYQCMESLPGYLYQVRINVRKAKAHSRKVLFTCSRGRERSFHANSDSSRSSLVVLKGSLWEFYLIWYQNPPRQWGILFVMLALFISKIFCYSPRKNISLT